MPKHKVMGILNVTPDSFFDKGAYFSFEKAIERGKAIFEEGADIIDIGGASSRPGADIVEEDEELRRVLPVVEQMASIMPVSIDTYRPKVAAAAIEKGACLINDITGFRDPAMIEVAASCKADLCLMHMQSTPQTMQKNPFYPDGVISEIRQFFENQIEMLEKAGIDRSRIILDPGIGFGKTAQHNLEIIKATAKFKKFGLRILIGASNKSFLGKIINMSRSSTELLPATLAIHTISLIEGADIIRVHHVKEHRDIVELIHQY